MEELRFACRQAAPMLPPGGICHLSDSDLLRAAGHLGISAAALKAFCIPDPGGSGCGSPGGSSAPFLLDDGCQLHPDKPTRAAFSRSGRNWLSILPSGVPLRNLSGMGTGPVTRSGRPRRAQGCDRYPALYPSQPRVRRRQKSVAGSAGQRLSAFYFWLIHRRIRVESLVPPVGKPNAKPTADVESDWRRS